MNFKKWLESRDANLSNEIAQTEGIRGALNWMGKKAAPAVLAGASMMGGTADAPSVQSHQNAMAQHRQAMAQHRQDMSSINGEIEKTGRFLDDEEDKEHDAEDAEIRQGGDEDFNNRVIARKKIIRQVMGKPSQRAADSAEMDNTEMDLDSRNRYSFNHDAAASNNTDKWKRSKEVEDILNKTRANDVLKKYIR